MFFHTRSNLLMIGQPTCVPTSLRLKEKSSVTNGSDEETGSSLSLLAIVTSHLRHSNCLFFKLKKISQKIRFGIPSCQNKANVVMTGCLPSPT